MLQIDIKDRPMLLEALEELMYKLSLQLKDLKGKPLTKKREELTRKQTELEKLQHLISAME